MVWVGLALSLCGTGDGVSGCLGCQQVPLCHPCPAISPQYFGDHLWVSLWLWFCSFIFSFPSRQGAMRRQRPCPRWALPPWDAGILSV